MQSASMSTNFCGESLMKRLFKLRPETAQSVVRLATAWTMGFIPGTFQDTSLSRPITYVVHPAYQGAEVMLSWPLTSIYCRGYESVTHGAKDKFKFTGKSKIIFKNNGSSPITSLGAVPHLQY
jgi:hypothetical protein